MKRTFALVVATATILSFDAAAQQSGATADDVLKAVTTAMGTARLRAVQYTGTGSGTYGCTALVDRTAAGTFSVSVGVRYQDVKWMRGRETTHRSASRMTKFA